MMTILLIVALVVVGGLTLGLMNSVVRGCPIALTAFFAGGLDVLCVVLKSITQSIVESISN